MIQLEIKLKILLKYEKQHGTEHLNDVELTGKKLIKTLINKLDGKREKIWERKKGNYLERRIGKDSLTELSEMGTYEKVN